VVGSLVSTVTVMVSEWSVWLVHWSVLSMLWSVSVNSCGRVAGKKETQSHVKPFAIFSDEPTSENSRFVLCLF